MENSDVEAQLMLLFSRMVVRTVSHTSLEEIRQFFHANPNLDVAQYMPMLTQVVSNHVTLELLAEFNVHTTEVGPGPQGHTVATARSPFWAKGLTNFSRESMIHTSPHREETLARERRGCSCPVSKSSPLLEMRKRREAKMHRKRKDESEAERK